jgi:putative tricarboxylic transport membrane protein
MDTPAMAAGMRKTDFIAGLLLLGLALVVAEESLRLPFGTMRRPGIAFLPVLLSVLLAFLSIALIVQARKRRAAADGPGLQLGLWKKVVASLAALFAFGFIFEWLGYIMSTILLLVFLMRAVEPVRWWLVLVVAVSSSLVTYIVFSLLGTPLPAGFLGR